VRYGPVQLVLSVPEGEALFGWANEAHKRQAAQVFFRDASGGSVVETLELKAAYCVAYHEQFVSGDAQGGAYQCVVTLSDPDGWTLNAGGPASAFVAPVAREHGLPAAAAGVAGSALRNVAIGGGPAAPRTLVDPADVPPHLGPPVPVPSPDHQQVHLTAAEWQNLIKGRWDDSDEAKGKTLLKPHRMSEFHVAGDPFVYRTDERGKIIAVYDAHKSYNVTGSKNGLMGIPLTLNGQPTYAGTPHLMPVTGVQKNVVEIDMVGNRAGDFKQANERAGLAALIKSQGLDANEAPDGYTWHHRDDFKPKSPPNPPYGTCTMELVTVQAHRDTFVHYGSCDQCNKHFHQKLYK
jgi:hypothetical protein